MNTNPIPQKTRSPAPMVLNPVMQGLIQATVVLGLIAMWWSQTRHLDNRNATAEDRIESKDRETTANPNANDLGGQPAIHYHVDLNSADRLELQLLPGVGQITAAQILEDRRDRGPFGSIDDLTRVAGVGEKTIQAIRAYCVVKSPSPSDASSTLSDNESVNLRR